MKSGNLNALEHSRPLQACNGTALSFYYVKVNGQLHAPAALQPETEPGTHWIKEMVGALGRSGHFGIKKNLLPIVESETWLCCRPARSLYSRYIEWAIPAPI